jgi:hypothetical protein
VTADVVATPGFLMRDLRAEGYAIIDAALSNRELAPTHGMSYIITEG